MDDSDELRKDTDNSEDTDRHGLERIRRKQGLYNLLQYYGPQTMKTTELG
jgi:hypothetical protein